MKKYTIEQHAFLGFVGLFYSTLLLAGVVSITTPTPAPVDATNNDVTVSGAGSITANGGNSALTINNVTTATNISVQNTSATDEISVTPGNGAIFISNAHVTNAPIAVTIDANASVKSGNGATFNVASGATAASTINFTNNGIISGASSNNIIIFQDTAGSNNTITINNNGTMQSSSNDNTRGIYSLRPDSVTTPLTINNSGTIFGTQAAIEIAEPTTASNPIIVNNSGTLTSTQRGMYLSLRAASTSRIINTSTGIINGPTTALLLAPRMSDIGGGVANIDNAGIIRATNTNAKAISFFDYISIINNSGTIESNTGATSSAIDSSSYLGTLNNNVGGIIRSTGNAISLTFSPGNTGVINNRGTISSTSGSAISINGSNFANVTINQLSGSMSGALSLVGNVILNATGGSITGDTTCNSGGLCAMNVLGNFSTGGNYSYMKSIRTQNAATQFNIQHAMTNVDTSVTTDANTTLFIKNGGSISGTLTSGLTNNGTLGFELGNGNDTTTTPAVAIANNACGYINMGTTAFNAASTKFKVTQAASTTLVKDARFYVLRTTGGVTNIGSAVLDGTGAPLLVLSVNSDASGIYFKVTDILPPPVVTSGSAAPLTFIQTLTALPSSSSQTIAVIISSPLLSSLRAVLDAQTNPITAIEYIQRLSPASVTESISALSANNSYLFDTSALTRTLALTEHRRMQHYTAGSRPGLKGAWGQFLKANAIQHKRSTSVGYTATSIGFVLGADEQVFDSHQLGAAFGLITTQASTSLPSPDNMAINTASALVYGVYDINDQATLDWNLNYNMSRFSGRRYVPASSSYAYSKFLGTQKGGKALISYTWDKNAIHWMPLVGFKLSESTIDPYAERGAALNTNLFVTTPSAMEATLSTGARVKYLKKLKEGSISPTFQLLANYDFRARPSSSSAQFIINGVAQGTSIFVQNDKTPNLSWTINAGMNIATLKSLNVDAQVNVTLKGNYHSEAGLFTLKYLW